jgi:hypothetical protein
MSRGPTSRQRLLMNLASRSAACDDPLADELSLIFTQCREYAEDYSTGGRGCINGLLMAVQIDTQPLQFGDEFDELLDRSSDTVDRPDHHDIKLAASGSLDQLIEGRALVPALAATADIVS